jgi:aspartate 1-decarboxylase
VISYAEYEEAELEGFQPKIVFVDERNRQVTKPTIKRAV